MIKSPSAIILAAALAAIPGARAEQGLIVHKALSLDMAMSMAQGSLEKCRSLGYKCGINILD